MSRSNGYINGYTNGYNNEYSNTPTPPSGTRAPQGTPVGSNTPSRNSPQRGIPRGQSGLRDTDLDPDPNEGKIIDCSQPNNDVSRELVKIKMDRDGRIVATRGQRAKDLRESLGGHWFIGETVLVVFDSSGGVEGLQPLADSS